MGSLADNTSGGTYAYRASKSALNQVTKSLAIDLEPQGITVSLLHPGWVRTDITGGRWVRSCQIPLLLMLSHNYDWAAWLTDAGFRASNM